MVYAHLQEQVPNTTKKHNNRWLPGLPQLTTRAEVFPNSQNPSEGPKTDRNHIPDGQPSGTSPQEQLDRND